MSFNSNAPESIEVDFERTIELRNPEAKIYVLEDEVKKVSGDCATHAVNITGQRG